MIKTRLLRSHSISDQFIDNLRNSMLFDGFSSEQLQQVVTSMQPKTITFKNGERVYKRGESADCCWLILSGKLTVMNTNFRKPFRRMIYKKGSVTGIQGLADPGSKRVVTIIAEDNVKLIKITHEGISRLESETQIQLWKNVSKLLQHKLSICLSGEQVVS